MTRKPAVLFLCTHNAARSQMAEALLRRDAGSQFAAFSAGLQPTEVHPMTRQVLIEVGIDASGLRAKGVQEFMGKMAVRYAIVVCEETEAACPRVFPFALETLRWPFEDPARPEGGRDLQLARFRCTQRHRGPHWCLGARERTAVGRTGAVYGEERLPALGAPGAVDTRPQDRRGLTPDAPQQRGRHHPERRGR